MFLSASLELRVGIQTTTLGPEHTAALPSFVIRPEVLSVPLGPQKEDSRSVPPPPPPGVFAGLPSTYFFYIQQVSLSALNNSHTSCSPGPNQHSYVARWLLCDSVVTICTRLLLSVTSLWIAASYSIIFVFNWVLNKFSVLYSFFFNPVYFIYWVLRSEIHPVGPAVLEPVWTGLRLQGEVRKWNIISD